MSEFLPVTTKTDLGQLDFYEIAEGYSAGIKNSPEPGNDKSRAFWHGWRNGMADGDHMPVDAAQLFLAINVGNSYKPTGRPS